MSKYIESVQSSSMEIIQHIFRVQDFLVSQIEKIGTEQKRELAKLKANLLEDHKVLMKGYDKEKLDAYAHLFQEGFGINKNESKYQKVTRIVKNFEDKIKELSPEFLEMSPELEEESRKEKYIPYKDEKVLYLDNSEGNIHGQLLLSYNNYTSLLILKSRGFWDGFHYVLMENSLTYFDTESKKSKARMKWKNKKLILWKSIINKDLLLFREFK